MSETLPGASSASSAYSTTGTPWLAVEQGGSCICTTEALGVWLQWMFTGKGGGYSSP